MTKGIYVKSQKALVCTAIALVGSSCGSDSTTATSKVTPELQRIGSTISSLVERQNSFLSSGSVSMLAGSIPANSNITVEVLKVPIHSITIEGVSASGTTITGKIYTCSGSTDEACYVDLASGSALTNLLSSSTNSATGSVDVGTYSKVIINNCTGSSASYTGKLKAKGNTDPAAPATIAYYTKAGSETLSTLASEYGEASLTYTGCTQTYPIPTPVAVKEGEPVSLKLLFHGYGIAAFAKGDGTQYGQATQACMVGGCTWSSTQYASGNFAITNFLQVIGTIDSGTPTIEFYRTSRHLTGATDNMVGLIGLIYSSGGTYIGGFLRAYYDTVNGVANNSFLGSIETFTETSSEVYKIATTGSSSSPNKPYLTIEGFKRIATAQNALVCKDTESTAFECDVTKITP
jgi:hypothetical protein